MISKNKLFFITVILISFLGVIAAFTMFTMQHIEKNSKKNIHSALKTVLYATQDSLHLWLQEQLEKMAFDLSRNNIVALTQKAAEQQKLANSPQKIAIENQLSTLLKQYLTISNYKSFTVISPQRTIIIDSEQGNRGLVSIIEQKRKPYLNKVFAGETLFIPPIISDLPLLNTTGKHTANLISIYLATPIKNAQDEIIAVIAFALDPNENFTRIMNIARVGKSGETYAFDHAARLISQSRFTQQLRDDGQIGRGDMPLLHIKITDPGTNLLNNPQKGLPVDKRPLTFMATNALNNNFVPHYEAYRDYRGVRVFGVWLWDKVLDIGIATEIDESEALLPHVETRKIIYIFMVMMLLLSMLMLMLLIAFTNKEKQIMLAANKRLKKEVAQRTLALEQSNLTLQKLSELDPLTNIPNRRVYEKELTHKLSEAYRTQQPLSLLMVDIDYFKLYNDNYGHDAGDKALFSVAQTILESLPRTTDMVARFGGEEFVVLLPSTDDEGAQKVAERIRGNIELTALEHQFSKVADILTISIGSTTLLAFDKKINATTFFKQADKALYQAKEQGRNCVNAYKT